MSAATPEAILESAAEVLRDAQFAVAVEVLEAVGRHWLLAENELFAVAAVAAENLADLAQLEPVAARALLDRLGGLGSGAKRWDAYLVLLTPQRWEEIDSRERVELEYDTRGIRRLVGAEVAPDARGELRPALERALTPFRPLGEPLGAALGDLNEDLVAALVLNGVDAEAAPRYVAAFMAKGSLEDV